MNKGISGYFTCKVFKNINKDKRIKKIKKNLKEFKIKFQENILKIGEVKTVTKRAKIYWNFSKKIRLIHRKISNIRNIDLHQIINEIVKIELSKIVMEDQNVKGMMKNGYLSKAIAEQNFNRFTINQDFI